MLKIEKAQIHEYNFNESSRICFSLLQKQYLKKQRFREKMSIGYKSWIHVTFKPSLKLCVKSEFFIIKIK